MLFPQKSIHTSRAAEKGNKGLNRGGEGDGKGMAGG